MILFYLFFFESRMKDKPFKLGMGSSGIDSRLQFLYSRTATYLISKWRQFSHGCSGQGLNLGYVTSCHLCRLSSCLCGLVSYLCGLSFHLYELSSHVYVGSLLGLNPTSQVNKKTFILICIAWLSWACKYSKEKNVD